MHVTNVLQDTVNISDNVNTTTSPVDALPPTVAIRLDRVKRQCDGSLVGQAGKDMALGFSLPEEGDDVLARLSDRCLSVQSGRGQAPT